MTFLSCISIHGVGESFLMQSLSANMQSNASVYQNHSGHQRCPLLQSVTSFFSQPALHLTTGLQRLYTTPSTAYVTIDTEGTLPCSKSCSTRNPCRKGQQVGKVFVRFHFRLLLFFYEYCFCSRITAGFDIGLPVANHIA